MRNCSLVTHTGLTMLDCLYQYARKRCVARVAVGMDISGASGAGTHSRPDDVSHEAFRHHCVRPVVVRFIICSRPRVGQIDVVAHYAHTYIRIVDVYR